MNEATQAVPQNNHEKAQQLDEVVKELELRNDLKKDLAQAREQYKAVKQQSEELRKNQQILARSEIALETLIGYLSTKLDK